jgi:hypothetical protein
MAGEMTSLLWEQVMQAELMKKLLPEQPPLEQRLAVVVVQKGNTGLALRKQKGLLVVVAQ